MSIVAADEAGEDLETLDLTSCKERIALLQAERERRLESTERLQEKLKALNNELAARRLEAHQKQDELHAEQEKNKKRHEQRHTEGTLQVQQQEHETKVRSYLEDMLQVKSTRSTHNASGFRTFDETELMVDKQTDEEAKEQPIDTVLITWIKPHSDDEMYNLSYRVDNKKTSKSLREDACAFWGVSEVDYILQTLENSKVQDDVPIQHCFRSSESAQLLLVQKDPTMIHLSGEREEQATRSKTKSRVNKKKKEQDQTPDPALANRAQGLVPWMHDTRKGLWEFMTQRDLNVVEHLQRTKLSGGCCYFATAILTLIVFWLVRPSNESYYVRFGPLTVLTASRITDAGMATVAFDEITTRSEAYDWVQSTLATQLLDPNSTLRLSVYTPGWVRLRMQQVGSPDHAACVPEQIVPDSSLCTPQYFHDGSAGTEDIMSIMRYWEGYNETSTTTTMAPTGPPGVATTTTTTTAVTTTTITGTLMNWTLPGVSGLDGRSSIVKPWRHITADENEEASGDQSVRGRVQKYSAAGYSLDYDLQTSNYTDLQTAFLTDLAFIRAQDEWFTPRTRALHITFTAFSANYDYWVSCHFTLEMPVASVVVPTKHLTVFRPTLQDSKYWRPIWILDIIRLLLLVYCATVQVYREVSYYSAKGKGWWAYFLSMSGLADLFSVCIFIYIAIVRYLVVGIFEDQAEFVADLGGDRYQSPALVAEWYRQQGVWEAPLLALLVFRIFFFIRVNRHVFIIWRLFKLAMRQGLRFGALLGPAFAGMVVWAHALWHSRHTYFTDMPNSLTGVIAIINGDIPFDSIFRPDRPGTFVYSLLLYFGVYFVVINGWVAVLIHIYQTCRVEAGFDAADYDWKEWQYARWCLWRPFSRYYLTHIRPRIEKPKDMQEDQDSP